MNRTWNTGIIHTNGIGGVIGAGNIAIFSEITVVLVIAKCGYDILI